LPKTPKKNLYLVLTMILRFLNLFKKFNFHGKKLEIDNVFISLLKIINTSLLFFCYHRFIGLNAELVGS